MSNVIVGKVGRSTFFDRKKWKDGAGNNEFPILLSKIAKLNPHNTYYFIGKSDLSRVSDQVLDEWFPHDNVIDVWLGFNSKADDPTTWVKKYLEGTPIDYGIIHGGMCSLSIPDRILCLDRKTKEPIPGKIRKPIQSLVNYVSPITYFLNSRPNLPWVSFTSDGRYMPLPARDLMNPEKISLGVRSGEKTIKRMKSYEEQDVMIEHNVEQRYVGAEFQYLLDEKWQFPRNDEKTQKVGIFFHKYDKKKRIKDIEDFVINNFDDDELAVYGKWPGYEGEKFKGTVPFDELQEILPSVKYTFVYPIIKGDISGKWVEAVANGIIPFFHESYDENRILRDVHDIPPFFFVDTPKDLKDKIEILEMDKELYNRATRLFFNAVYKDEYMNGTHFDQEIKKAIDDINGRS